jgi:hypothetical protein
MTVDVGSTLTCHVVLAENNENTTTRRINMENTATFPGQSFRWKSDHPTMKKYVKLILKTSKEEKEEIEQPDFLESFTKIE